MEEKIKFQESLREIEAYALKKDKALTIEEINSFFEKMNLTKEQMNLVYNYLITKKIIITDYEPVERSLDKSERLDDSGDSNKKDTEQNEEIIEEQKVLNLYLEEMETVSSCEADTEKDMLLKAIKGDGSAKSYLINYNLKRVVAIAKRYQDNGVELSDLIQEGNVALVLAMDSLKEVSFDAGGKVETFHDYLTDVVTKTILDVISLEDALNSSNEEILEKVNYINEAAKNLTEEMGKTVSLEEVAKYLSMEPEEIEDILSLSAKESPIEKHHDHHHDLG